ncbi:MAG: DUF1552 domain-containing protein, partial [Nannocystaceae bacterium]|nr:DUF1552 domain-containing protein [Nannocystaceae bacterium]
MNAMHILRSRTRRSFLQTLGFGAAAAPFIPLLDSHAAGGVPRRVLFFHTPHGLARDAWKPSGMGEGWSLSPILQPLAAFKDRMVAVTGMNAEAAKSGQTPDHKRAQWTYLTGQGLNANEQTAGPSLDQVLADVVTESNNLYPSLESGVLSDFPGLNSRGPGEELSPVMDPSIQFERLFGALGEGDEALLELKARRRSILDSVRMDLDAIRNQVAPEDAAKIENHLDGVDRLEEKLDSLGQLPASCVVPGAPPNLQPDNESQYPEIGRAHLDVLASAFACDLTRVATIKFAGGQLIFDWIDGIDNVQHDNCHNGDRPSRPLYDDLTATSIWYAQELAYLAERLDAMPEGDGTVLDNTLIVWTTEMADGGHDWDDMPITMLGGGPLIGDQRVDGSGR